MSKFWLFCQFCATRIIYIYVFITQTYLKQKQIFFIVRQGTYFTTRKLSIGLRKSASVLNDNLRRNMANHGNPRLTCCVYVCVYDCICAYWIYMVLFGDIPNHSTSWSVENLWGADVDTIFSSVYKWDSQWDNRKWLDMDQITDHSPPGWSSGPVHKRLAMANMLVTYAMFWCWPHGCAFQLVYQWPCLSIYSLYLGYQNYQRCLECLCSLCNSSHLKHIPILVLLHDKVKPRIDL